MVQFICGDEFNDVNNKISWKNQCSIAFGFCQCQSKWYITKKIHVCSFCFSLVQHKNWYFQLNYRDILSNAFQMKMGRWHEREFYWFKSFAIFGISIFRPKFPENSVCDRDGAIVKFYGEKYPIQTMQIAKFVHWWRGNIVFNARRYSMTNFHWKCAFFC